MSSRTGGLLAQIEAGVLDDSVPLSTVLRKVIVLGGKAGSEKMREWARLELNGYVGSKEPLPSYRRIPAALHVRITNQAGYNAITQRINPSDLPEFMTEQVDVEEAGLGGGIGELEALAANHGGSDKPHWLSPSWSGVVVDYLNKYATDEFSVPVGVYWEVSHASIKGLLVRVRAALAELVAELASLTPGIHDVPTKAAADQAVQFVMTGERPTINITAQSAAIAGGDGTAVGSQIVSGENSTVVGTQVARDNGTIAGRDSTAPPLPEPKHEGWWTRLRKRGAVVAFATIAGGMAGVVGAIAAVLTLLEWTPW